jgi:hypothetical protein
MYDRLLYIGIKKRGDQRCYEKLLAPVIKWRSQFMMEALRDLRT